MALSTDNMDSENSALMTRQQVIDEITDDRIGFVAQLCHYPADECAAARVPLQINCSVNISSAVNLGPAVRTARLLVPDFDETEFFLQLRIAHDFVPQGSAAGRDYLNHRLHAHLDSAATCSFGNVCL
jgi:hypothetical protein